jgi:hypothetical protein
MSDERLRAALVEWDAIEGSDLAAQFRAFIAAGKMADAIRAALATPDPAPDRVACICGRSVLRENWSNHLLRQDSRPHRVTPDPAPEGPFWNRRWAVLEDEDNRLCVVTDDDSADYVVWPEMDERDVQRVVDAHNTVLGVAKAEQS